MDRSLWLSSNGVEYHTRRDCRGATDVDAISMTSPRLVLFDPCRRCVPGSSRLSRDERPVASESVLAALRNRPESTRERLRTEATRRGVTYNEWVARVARLETFDARVVIDLTRQSASVTS